MADIGGSQNDEFSAGLNHLTNAGRANDNSVTLGGLQADSDRWNEMSSQAATTPHSVLQSVMPSGNGMSAEDAARQMPGGGPTLPSPNGSGQDTYQQSALLGRLYGTD